MEKSSSVVLFLVVQLFFEGLQLCFCKNSTFSCIKREKDALLQLKQSFTDPSNRLVSWTGNDCCQWKGVSCNQNSGHVVKLDLRVPSESSMDGSGDLYFHLDSSKGLSAMEVHSCLGELTHLQYLDLSGNNFKESQIPKFFGSLKHLRYLNLSSAGFRGRIPVQLGNLTTLQFLDLGGPYYLEYWHSLYAHNFQWISSLGLYADNFQWISSLSSLKYIDMSYVNLSKALDVMQVLNTLPFLIHLRLRECGIQNIHFPHGSLNSTFLARVQFLSLQGNSLTGSIPNAIQNMTALRELDLSYQWNRYSGEFYADNFQWISSLASLRYLDMSYVNLSKALDMIEVLNTLPSLIGLRLSSCGIRNIHFPHGSLNSTFLARVQFLSLSDNSLTGSIPNAIQNMTALRELDLGYQWNWYSGELYVDNFQWISSFASLRYLDMSLVNLSKALDMIEVLNMLPSLIGLRLRGCGIRNIHFPRGSLNSTFLTRVQFLSLSGNSLTGSIPNTIQNMTALRELDLSNQWNRYSGELYVDNLQWASSLLSLQHLDMSGVNLSKALDLMQVLNMLPSLIGLRLSSCGIRNIHFPHGSLNSTFLTRVQFLSLSDNSLTGSIPNAFQNMTAVRALDLSANDFNSTIPLWLVNSKSLVDLNLGWNEFKNIEGGMFSMLNEACSLRSLDLSHNSFHGEVLGSKKNSSRCLTYDLEFLNLRYSGISGNLPNYFGQLKGLKKLDLLGNSLSGPIPSFFGELPVLRSLYLSQNQFNGTIPQFSGRLSTLEQLILSDNQLKGIIPQWLVRFSSLQVLDLSNNQLNGTIPENLGELSKLEYLRLSHNQLSGSIPTSLGQLVNLYELDISSNSLHGVVSELHFANLSNLKMLDTSSNHLTLKVKSDWIPPFSLSKINMSSCIIGSEFPRWIQTQTTVWSLDLSNASISGGFPIWLCSMSPYKLDLSKNQISGSLPADIFDTMPNIRYLLLGNNLLNGSMPNSLCKLERLEVLDLSRNKLTGEVPHCWKDTQRVYVINLSYNMLSGLIPWSIGHLSFLKRLHADGNNLTGELPLALRNCRELELLDLGENKFSGFIPTWIGGSLSSLLILRLRKNMLKGILPSELCQLNKLQILDLADNDLRGGIPRCFGKLTGMITKKVTISEAPASPPIRKQPPAPPKQHQDDDTDWRREKVREVTKGLDLEYTKMQLKLLVFMDLSSNKLVGGIPEELCLLSGLRGLNLSHNRLSGNIPKKIGELKLLESLDLSNNSLCGSIPPSMSALPSISHLNLSHNNLSGKIPTSNQLQTLIDPSIYVGNLGLCGDPLPKCPGDDDPAKPPTSMAHEDEDHEEDKKEKILFYFVVLAGYATGLWGVIGTLVFKRNWRLAYFRFGDKAKEWILMMVAVKVARLKKIMQRTNTED